MGMENEWNKYIHYAKLSMKYQFVARLLSLLILWHFPEKFIISLDKPFGELTKFKKIC